MSNANKNSQDDTIWSTLTNWSTFAAATLARWQEYKNVHWSIIPAVLLLITSIFICSCGSSTPPNIKRFELECRSPRPIQPWRTQSFRPRWFGLMGGPGPLTYRTKGRRMHQVSVVALDKRDIEIRMWVDNKDHSYKVVDIDDSVDCGDDVGRCILMGFASASVIVPPGNHIVRAEIVNDNGTFRWGTERQRRVKWLVDECLWS